MTEGDRRGLIHTPVWVAAIAAIIFVVVLLLNRRPGILVIVAMTAVVGAVGWVSQGGHLDSQDERLLKMLFAEPGMPSDQFRAASGLGPDECALTVHRLKDGGWIEWGWGAYHLTPKAKARLQRKT